MMRWRFTFIVVVAGSALLTTGCSSTSAAISATTISIARPSSPPSIVYDVAVTRTFTADNTTATCTVSVKVVPDPQTAGADANQRVTAARKFLVAHDWQTTPVTLSEMSAADQKVNRDRGISDAAMLATVLNDDIGTALTTAGLMGNGVATRGAVGCK
jgi:DNA-binding beta-propeller fold protein YncE